MKGIVLAAGDGGRLRPLTLDTPKVLLGMGGRPLIHYALEALSSAGISDIGVVVGHQAAKVREALEQTHPDVAFIYNEHYLGGNARSIYAARSFVSEEPFVVCMGDHPIGPEIVRRLLSFRREECVLCVDHEAWHPSQINDGTRVLADAAGYITEIGKQLKVWTAIDTGVFKMTEEVFLAIEHLMKSRGVDVGISEVVQLMGETGQPFATCNVSGMFWADVDTLDDYTSIDGLLRERYGERV